MLERDFQKDLIKEIEIRFPGSVVTKQDSTYIQGIPDLCVFYKDKWAWLEVKKSEDDAIHHPRPNQPYYVDLGNRMSFASFIYPENKEKVLDELGNYLEQSLES